MSLAPPTVGELAQVAHQLMLVKGYTLAVPSGATETAIMELIVSKTFTPKQISEVRHRCKTCHLMADLQLHCAGLILPCTGTARACNLDKKQRAKQLLRSDPVAFSPTASITLWCQNPIKGRAKKTEGDHRFGSGCTGWERYCKELFAGYEAEVNNILSFL